jgi:UDP-glucose 4-epimerase
MFQVSLVRTSRHCNILLGGGDSIAVNLAGGRGAYVREVIDTACAVTGRKINACEARRRPGDWSILVAEVGSTRKLLGWSAERSDLAAIISDAWRLAQNACRRPGKSRRYRGYIFLG